jgi:hypothetical protein
MTTLNTEEWQGDHPLPESGRRRVTVCHTAGEWAHDDGDGIREVPDNGRVS